MPLYEYQCTACGHRFDQIQKLGARAPRCPQCKAPTRKQISSPAIQFKGTGWYLTDYARKGKGGGSETGGGDSGGSTDGAAAPTAAAADKAADKTAAGTGAKAAEKSPAGKGSSGKGSAGAASD